MAFISDEYQSVAGLVYVTDLHSGTVVAYELAEGEFLAVVRHDTGQEVESALCVFH